jgi:prephenate dehydrogenase
MTVQITIIGLGQIGTSIGLALAEHTDVVYRVGHDKELGIANQAKKMGALDRTDINIPNAVEEADLVILALPIDQIKEMMEVIAPHLRGDAVVMDTAPVKQKVSAWAVELLPEKRHYVGLTPVLNAAYLHSYESGIEAAHEDLFRKGMIAIVSPPGTPSAAIKLATDFTHLLGAEHLFMDLVEVDSLMTATHVTPQLISAALASITIDQPGWREGRKLAGRPYAEVTSPVVGSGDAGGLASSALLSSEHAVRWLNNLITSLIQIRDDIQDQDEKMLVERLGRVRDGRERWWRERQMGEWAAEETAPPVEMPTAREVAGRLVGLGRPKKEKKSEDEV